MARKSTKTVGTAAATDNAAAATTISNDTMVPCRNGTAGNLIYKSSLNPGYVVEWSEFGDTQELEYRELVSMRGNQRRFFEENWILIDDPAVIKKLGVESCYKNSLTTDNFNDVFKMSPAEIKDTVPSLPGGTRDAIAAKAKEMMDTGELDSRSTIKALSDSLDVDLEDNI